MENKNRLVWFEGSIIPLDEAKINIMSPSSQYGINVFEGIRAYWNDKDQQLYIFKLEEHIERLLDSSKLLRFNHNFSARELKKSIIETIKANQFKADTSIRQVLYVDEEDGSWSSKNEIKLVVSPILKEAKKDYLGITCCVSSWERINDNSMSPRIKSGANYLNSRMAQLDAIEKGFDSAILLNQDKKVSEAPGSCIMIIKNNTLISPKVTDSILDSITRKTILQIVEEMKITIQEREVDKTELYLADEVFLCGTSVEIIPVTNIDNYQISKGRVGSITKKILTEYFRIVKGENSSWKKYLTKVY